MSLVAYATQRTEAESIASTIVREIRAGRRRPRDFAIFYRVNALSRSLEFALRDEGVPYQMVNALEFYERREIKDALAYLHLLNNPRDDNAFLRVVNMPPRGIGKGTLARLSEHAGQRGLSLLEAARQSGLIESLTKRAAVAIAKFVSLYDRLSLVAAAPVEEILGHVLEASGYRQFLADSEDEEDEERLANIEELLTAARQFDEAHPSDGALEAFLEESCLVNDTDAWQADDDRVTLMTLHASKGLEFPVVFIVALEEGLVPHERSRENDELLEEERRLLFVGITRAREELQLSIATYREFRGQRRRTVPSPFLFELPRGEMRLVEPTSAASRWTEPEDENLDDADISFDVEAFDAEEFDGGKPATQRDAGAPAASTARAALSTAAELHAPAHAPSERVSPDAFHQGMVVRHPEYGLGKVVALSGGGSKRSATVAFFASTAGQKKFILAQSPLRPAKSV